MYLFHIRIHILKIYCNNKISNIYLTEHLLCALNVLINWIFVTPYEVLTVTILILKLSKVRQSGNLQSKSENWVVKPVIELGTKAVWLRACVNTLMINHMAWCVELPWPYLQLMLVIQLITVWFSDYLQENRTPQEILAPEPVPQKKIEKSKEKKDQTRLCKS